MTAKKSTWILLSAFIVAAFIFWAVPFAKAEEYDITQCYSGTVTPMISGDKITILTFEHRGIATSNHPDKVFDNNTFHCIGIIRIVGKDIVQIGNCKYQSPDGSINVGEFTGNQREGTWKYIYGTGKYEGIEGGGPWKIQTHGKPIAPGTFQNCNRATGKFNLKK